LVDDDNIAWFSAIDVTIALGFKNTKNARQTAINKNVLKKDIKQLQYINIGNKKGHPHTLYINEPGLYRLMLRSRLKKAEQFSEWVTHDVLPSIRKFGSYKLIEEHKKELHNILDKINYLESENKKLREDQCKTKYPNGGLVYVIDYSSSHEDIYRIGMTGNMASRKKIYNTHTLHNHTVVHFVTADCPLQLESCVRALLYKYRYTNKKDFFVCNLSVIKRAFTKCIKNLKEMDVQTGGNVNDNPLISQQLILSQKKEKLLKTQITKQRKLLQNLT
jgi:prophage antirepressor-like protein